MVATPNSLSTKAFGFVGDLFIGAYILSVLDRVVVPTLADYVAFPLSPAHAIAYIVFAILFASTSLLMGVSLSAAFVRKTLPDGISRKILTHIGYFLLSISIIAGWIITDVSPIEFFSGKGLAGAGRIFGALVTPEFDIIGQALATMVETIYTALMATLIAVPISFLLSFPAARNLMDGSRPKRLIYSSLRVVLNVSRSMEPIIWAIVFSVWVGIGPFAGMLALVVHTIASLTKQYSEQIEDVDSGPIEAISATGANSIQTIWFAIVPQCVIPFLSFTIYRWDINVRMATIIGFVGGGGIGTLLIQYQGLAKFHEVGTLIIVITFVVWILDVFSARIREALK
ncbi:MAG: phosphonate ABC transporter, permease protein PhnE [Ignavibacteria bacterium]|nr:phosphonate ABC transporter, permease protein PhnE [Ignavibacteria bacterium]